MNMEIDNFAVDYNFSSLVFRINKPEFLALVKPVFNEYVEVSKRYVDPLNPYPGIITEKISGDERIEEFLKYISDISWDILYKQGYDMELFYTDASEMWGQQHPRTSSMEKHAHGQGSFLSGFYFLDTPENSSKMFLHDPSFVKTYLNLPIRQSKELFTAHSSVFYNPKPGDLIFTNSWIEHSFTRNANHLPYNFIHINVKVVPREQNTPVIV